MRCNIPARDLHQKLDNTLCRYKGRPVYVRVDSGRAGVHIYNVHDTNTPIDKIKATDPDFDVASIPLGYVQYRDRVYHLARIPVRRVKQGLDIRSIRVRNLDGSGGDILVNHLIFSKEFEEMVANRGNRLSDVLGYLRAQSKKDNSRVYERVLSRDIALGINKMGIINVYFKGVHVGWMQPDKDIVHVPSDEMGWIVSKYLSHELSWKID